MQELYAIELGFIFMRHVYAIYVDARAGLLSIWAQLQRTRRSVRSTRDQHDESFRQSVDVGYDCQRGTETIPSCFRSKTATLRMYSAAKERERERKRERE